MHFLLWLAKGRRPSRESPQQQMPGACSRAPVPLKRAPANSDTAWAEKGFPSDAAARLSARMGVAGVPLPSTVAFSLYNLLAPEDRALSLAEMSSRLTTPMAAPWETRYSAAGASTRLKGRTKTRGRPDARASEVVRPPGFVTQTSDTAMSSGMCAVNPSRLKFCGRIPLAASRKASRSPGSFRPATAMTVSSQYTWACANNRSQTSTLFLVLSDAGSAKIVLPFASGAGTRYSSPLFVRVATASSLLSVLNL
mmetsp:Transcript_108730/g.307539  ORF Transcript_108730/g.307539 Transcript_108730/m.307539 type:complete len:253 (+) Transcript_108730:259-1017(+)